MRTDGFGGLAAGRDAEPVLRLERLDASEVHWDELDALADRTVFQTREWLEFVASTQGAEAVVARLTRAGEVVGYFTGLVTLKCGLRLLGSPLPGWTTDYMGFNRLSPVEGRELLLALERFAFRDLRCVHLEVMDRHLSLLDRPASRFGYRLYEGYEVDLRPSEDELFASMSSACRRCIRRAEKCGVAIEEASDDEFAEDYHAQLRDVFAKQSLVPTYDQERVRMLLRALSGAGRLLLLRARSPEGRCIATGIFPAMNGTMHFWGGASWRRFQILRPNEALQWYAMRYWKQRGMERYDMGGAGAYKRKYGGRPIIIPWFRVSKYPWLPVARFAVQRWVALRQSREGRRAAKCSGGE